MKDQQEAEVRDSIATSKAEEGEVKELRLELGNLTKTIDKLEFENQELEEKVEDLTKELEEVKKKEAKPGPGESDTGRYSSASTRKVPVGSGTNIEDRIINA